MMRSQLPNKLTSEMKGAASLTEQILTLSGRPTDRRQAMSAFRGKADISWEKGDISDWAQSLMGRSYILIRSRGTMLVRFRAD